MSTLPEDQILQSELRQVLERAIGELPENYRPVILLRDIEELSTQETAQILDLTEDVVKTRLHRARLALRQKLDAYLRVRAPAAVSHGAIRGNEMDSNESSEKCREVFALLSDYLDLELPPDACEVIEARLHGCPPCVKFAESLQKTVELCRQYRSSEFPSTMGDRAREDLLQTYKTYKNMLADG